jgi:hypothetical protein
MLEVAQLQMFGAMNAPEAGNPSSNLRSMDKASEADKMGPKVSY